MNSEVRGKRRGWSNPWIDISAGKQHDLNVSMFLPPYAHLALLDCGAIAQATTAVAGTTTIPTTTALGTLWNGEAAGGKVYIIDRLFANTEAYDAGDNFFFLWVCMHPVAMTAPTADITIKKLIGGNYGGNARFDVGATVVNDTWYSWGNSLRSAQANAEGMSNIDVPVEGRLILKPTAGMSIHVGCNDSNLTAQVGVAWFEIDEDYI